MCANSQKPRVLLVDDDEDFNERMTTELEGIGLRVTVVETGGDAIEAILSDQTKVDPFALMILDMQVPSEQPTDPVEKQLGLKLIRAFREVQDVSSILPSVIIFTNYPDFEDGIACIKAGACEFLAKVSPNSDDSTEVLLDCCRRILDPEKYDPEERDRAELRRWLEKNGDELIRRSDQDYAAVFSSLKFTEDELSSDYGRIGGKIVVWGCSYEDVLRKVLSDRLLRWENRRILNIQGH